MNGDRIWITGAGGLIGSYVCKLASEFVPAHSVVRPTRTDLDLARFSRVREEFIRLCPRLIIHCAALSRSPACQADPALAHKLNVEVTKVLTDLASEIPFVFFSSDLVFDGKKGYYDESDAANPLSVYAETKLAAELVVLANPRHTVIRTSLNGGTSPTGDRGFNEELRRAWLAGKTLRLFTDEFRSPTPAEVTARATWEIALAGVPGLYHVASSERMSRWHLGQLIAKRWPSLNPSIEPASLKEYTGAPRPPDTSLNCSKAQKLLSFDLPGLTDWLAERPDELF